MHAINVTNRDRTGLGARRRDLDRHLKYVIYLSCVMGAVFILGCGAAPNGNVALNPGEHSFKEYAYSGGQPKRIDFFGGDGKLRRSIWLMPNGEFVAESVFFRGSGIELYLYPDGSLQRIVPLKNWLAHGDAIEFDSAGVPSKVTSYTAGIEGTSRELTLVSGANRLKGSELRE